MLHLVLIVFATFWAWETLRYIAERYVSSAFLTTRPLHPFLVLGLPLWFLWPDYIAAMGVAGVVGLLVMATDYWFAPSAPQYIPPQRRMSGGQLPPLP